MSIIHWEEKLESCVQVPMISRVSGERTFASRTTVSVVHLLISDTLMTAHEFVRVSELPAFVSKYISTGEERLIRREVVWGPTTNAKNECVCRVRCTYDIDELTDAGSLKVRAPTVNDPVTVSMSWVERTIPLRVDRNGKRVTNTVGQEFFDPVTITRHDPIWSITRREFRNPLVVANSYEGKINYNAIWGCDARTLRVNTIESSFSPEVFGWMVTYNIEKKYDGWDLKPLNLGTRERVAGQSESDASYREILDEKGQPISDPVLLSKTGEQTDTPYYFADDPFVGYEAIDFSVLFLPNISDLA